MMVSKRSPIFQGRIVRVPCQTSGWPSKSIIMHLLHAELRTPNEKPNITRNKDKIPAKDTRDTPKRFVPIAMVYFLIFLKKISFHQKKHIRSFPGQTSSELWFSLGFSILYGLDSGSPTPLLSWGVPRWRCGTQGCESVCMVFLPHTHIYNLIYNIYVYTQSMKAVYIYVPFCCTCISRSILRLANFSKSDLWNRTGFFSPRLVEATVAT